ncbi:unnamed protein product, partial [Urochloa humidicola]
WQRLPGAAVGSHHPAAVEQAGDVAGALARAAMEVLLCRQMQFMEVEWLPPMNNLSKPRNVLQEKGRKEIRVMQ